MCTLRVTYYFTLHHYIITLSGGKGIIPWPNTFGVRRGGGGWVPYGVGGVREVQCTL